MSRQHEKTLRYSVQWVANLIEDATAQKKANRVKRRKLRALRAEVRRLREACRASDAVFNALDEIEWSRIASYTPLEGHGECPVEYDAAHALVREGLYVKNQPDGESP